MVLSVEIDTQLAKCLGGAKVTVQLMCVLVYRRLITTRFDTFIGPYNPGSGRFIKTWWDADVTRVPMPHPLI